ncbi:ABC transporter substrate-binding protein [Yoonia sp. 2307UL14-13]|uniref:ABC transporter substrate-binding protein n=1 Tax=Yoonia sp. 2307UL14-13 TaxID=3126506 RepID=UPI0030977A26
MRLLAFLAAIVFATSVVAQDVRTIIDASGTEVEIPVQPQRIIGMHDQSITLTLIELGAPVVGSMGRTTDDGTLYMRAVDLFYGLDFENSGIAFVGQWEAWDYETIAGLEPDLILEWEDADANHIEKLRAAGPVVLIPRSNEKFVSTRAIAEAAGVMDRFEFELARYDALVEDARRWVPQLQGASYAKIQGWDGSLEVYAGYGGITQVLEDLGMVRTDFAQAMSDRGVIWGETVSAETMPEHNADYIFDTFTVAYGDTAASPYERLNEVLPGWCDILTACAEGRYIVLPREHSTGTNFGSLERQLYYVVTHVGGRPSVTAVD